MKVPSLATADGWIRSEAEFAEAARAAGAPVPRLLGVEDIGGRTASVWERVQGASAWQLVVDRPARSAELGRLVAEMQLALFDLLPPVTLPRQHDRLASKIRRAVATIDPSLSRALQLLPPQPSVPRLCHGDLHPSNVILGPGGPMIVDWFDASRGEPVADIARSALLLRSDGAHPPRHLPGADPARLQSLTDAYLLRLAERFDLRGETFARWQALNAVARMAEGVACGVLVEVWTQHADADRRAYAAAS